MKKIKIIIWACVLAYLAISFLYTKSLRTDNKRLKGNQNQLLVELAQVKEDNGTYKIADSLNGIRTNELLLTLSEYERYRQLDAVLIGQLTDKNANLEKVISAQARTINDLSLKLIDSIIIDSVTMEIDTLKCFNYSSEWNDIRGCLDLRKSAVDLQIENRESLKIVETIKYKRFWGFLWKTRKVENKQVDIISENPNTVIVGSEVISIIQ